MVHDRAPGLAATDPHLVQAGFPDGGRGVQRLRGLRWIAVDGIGSGHPLPGLPGLIRLALMG